MTARVHADRSAVMRAVKSTGTRPELIVRHLVLALGRRYRLGGLNLPGKPDLVFPGSRKAIFVHGCFWHGHDCARGARAPRANAEYWRAKIERNRTRDAKVLAELRDAGWSALVIWECALRDRGAVAEAIAAHLCETDSFGGRPIRRPSA